MIKEPKKMNRRMRNARLAKIPQELKALAQWVAWREVLMDGKSKKIPVDPRTGDSASVNDPTTWASFSKAIKSYAAMSLDGIGFVLTADDPYVSVDLDDCRNPDTGAITPKAEKIVRTQKSYTEISPSGTGLHIFTGNSSE